jgi:hypothetical protein
MMSQLVSLVRTLWGCTPITSTAVRLRQPPKLCATYPQWPPCCKVNTKNVPAAKGLSKNNLGLTHNI